MFTYPKVLFPLYLQVDNGDACPAKLYVLISEVAYIGYGGQILPDERAEDACPRAVQDSHAPHTHLDGIVNKVGDGLHRQSKLQLVSLRHLSFRVHQYLDGNAGVFRA